MIYSIILDAAEILFVGFIIIGDIRSSCLIWYVEEDNMDLPEVSDELLKNDLKEREPSLERSAEASVSRCQIFLCID